jgi:hypothetical protein
VFLVQSMLMAMLGRALVAAACHAPGLQMEGQPLAMEGRCKYVK